MQIVPLNNRDLDSLTQVQPVGWTDIKIPIKFYIDSEYCYPFKIVIDDILVGTGTAILHDDIGWLSTIATHSEYRNKGIGKLITEHLLSFLQQQNCNYIYLIATALGEPVYKKVGFEIESRYMVYKDVNFYVSNFHKYYSLSRSV